MALSNEPNNKKNNKTISNVLIVSITPYFLERGAVWFEENLKTILKARKTQSFWQENTCVLEKDQQENLSEVLRKLDELGYEKVFKIQEPGEFSQRGGVVEVFPVNLKFAVRLDFLGNKIEAIEKLPLTIKDEKTAKNTLKRKLKTQRAFSDLRNLKPGNYLVHLDHGIGRFQGLKNLQVAPSRSQDYYVLEYDRGDKLYVPKGLERKLSRYIGFKEPRLSRLGTELWQRTKSKIKQGAEKLAKELLKVFAQKELAKRPPYREKELADSLESSFPYQLTPDQKQALQDIEKDLGKQAPMDRLICGDVGFGKTELALRSAVIAAENGKQAALIAPTTILASQHFETFQKRLRKSPLKTAMLSRLNKQEGPKVLKQTREGKVDILIGTHSLLSDRVAFHNLGLLIIDDEQKFGVKQKEKLRKLKPEVDVLYLSATPIPRTLYMALSSLKEISLIQTPPEGRKPIKTFVLPFKKETIKKAIEKELSRGGQVYFLHNRVETITAFKNLLETLKTKANIAVLHAKLPEKQIVEIITGFQKKKFDLLLTTTIIENGIDISSVNTLIVDNATRLGLSQAYQLRGRIGRGGVQAFAYFLYPKRALRGLAKERLSALKQAEELGSGYQIALRDLEIRGAGNILGKEQSGAVNRVGLNLYCQMLSLAVEKLKTKTEIKT